MAKVKEDASIAYCTPPLVDEPGFYVMEGEVEEVEHAITEGVGEGSFDESGKWNFQTTRNVDTHTVKHETRFQPTTRVYPDGDWFSDTEPEEEG